MITFILTLLGIFYFFSIIYTIFITNIKPKTLRDVLGLIWLCPMVFSGYLFMSLIIHWNTKYFKSVFFSLLLLIIFIIFKLY